MPDYKQGQIYRLWSPHTDKFYIGSTCNMLAKRLWDHRSKYNQYLKGISHFRSSFKLFELGFDDVKIELIELCPCNSKAELERREGELIRIHKDNIVNHFVAGRIIDLYKVECKEKLIESTKKSKEKHKEIYNKKNLERYHANKESIKIEKKKWRDANQEEINKKQREYYEIKKAKDAQELSIRSVSLE
jgi:hypothetical protein